MLPTTPERSRNMAAIKSAERRGAASIASICLTPSRSTGRSWRQPFSAARAVDVSIYVVRAFVQLRELLAGHKELAQRLDQLEARMERKLLTQDQAISDILDAIRQLMAPPAAPRNDPSGSLPATGRCSQKDEGPQRGPSIFSSYRAQRGGGGFLLLSTHSRRPASADLQRLCEINSSLAHFPLLAWYL